MDLPQEMPIVKITEGAPLVCVLWYAVRRTCWCIVVRYAPLSAPVQPPTYPVSRCFLDCPLLQVSSTCLSPSFSLSKVVCSLSSTLAKFLIHELLFNASNCFTIFSCLFFDKTYTHIHIFYQSTNKVLSSTMRSHSLLK